MTPDINVLVASFRQDHVHHQIASQWMRQRLEIARQQRDFSLLPTVVASFLRLVTHPRVFANPTSSTTAMEFVDRILASAGVKLLAVQREWQFLRSLVADHQLTGNAVPDAWIAASIIQHREILVTFDRDFTRLLPPQNLLLLRT